MRCNKEAGGMAFRLIPRAVRRKRVAPVMAVMLVLASYIFAIHHAVRGEWVSQTPHGYYGLVTDAFLNGRLHLDVAVDPRLAELENPYAGPQGSSRPHDMSYYKGRFYIYYGITPTLIAFYPFALATGVHLVETVVIGSFIAGSFLIAAALLFWAWRRWFPAVPSIVVGVGVLFLGWGLPSYAFVANTTFYLVPITGGLFCTFVALGFAWLAWRSGTFRQQVFWLLLASLAYGLAVASRPSYLLGLLGLVPGAFWLWSKLGRDRWRARGWIMFGVVVGPAALVGGMLLVYNHARFEDPLDFGIQYSMASADVRAEKLWGLTFIPRNLHQYLLSTSEWIRYFPFLNTGGRASGVLPHFPFIALACAWPLTLIDRRFRRDPLWVLTGVSFLVAGLAHLLMLCVFFGGADRYILDFGPVAAVPALLFAGFVWQSLARAPRGGAVVVKGLLGGFGLYSLVNGVLVAFPRGALGPLEVNVARALNRFPAHYEAWKGETYGPLEMQVVFRAGSAGEREPLVSAGTRPGQGDIVFLEHLGDGQGRVGFFYAGSGGPIGRPFSLRPGEPREVRILMGSLLPPELHPRYEGWAQADIRRLRRRVQVSVDGEIVLTGATLATYATPDHVHIGANPLLVDVCGPLFTGEITEVRQASLPELPLSVPGQGALSLRVRFPSAPLEAREPLVGTGLPGAGDLFFVYYLPGGLVKFGHDHWGGGEVLSAPLKLDFNKEYLIEIDMGSLHAQAWRDGQPGESRPITPVSRRLRASIDGKRILDVLRPFHPTAPGEVEIGYNGIGSSAAKEMFSGQVIEVSRLAPDPSPGAPKERGGVEMSLVFPAFVGAIAEPLVTTGEPGRGDFVYVVYDTPAQARIGVDHWGYGGFLSEPFAYNDREVQEIRIVLGSLLPPRDSPYWTGRDPASKRRIRVEINGEVLIDREWETFDATPAQVQLLRNTIGGSTVRDVFTGSEVVSPKRFDVP